MTIEIPTFKFALREDLKNEKQFLPTRGEPKATGWDVAAAPEDKKDIIIRPGEWVKIPLGFRAFIPEGWWLELRPRSSTYSKKNVHTLYGVVDQNYEGMMFFCGQYIPDGFIDEVSIDTYENHSEISCRSKNLKISFGEKIGQLVPVERKEMIVEEASNEEYDELCKIRGGKRGAGGFGSTGA